MVSDGLVFQSITQGFFSQNMAVLEKFNPLLAGELLKAENSLEVELVIETAASGDPAMLAGALHVHSMRDPRREAERLVEAAFGGNADEDPSLILGFGLGYAAEALARKHPSKPIIVIEKYPEIIIKAMETRDLGGLLSHKGLIFVLGGTGEDVTGALSLFRYTPGSPPVIIRNQALCGLDREWYSGAEDRIAAWNTRTNVNRATQKRFGKRWVKNLLKNLDAVRDFPGISCLEGILSGKNIPVLLAAAGPTLDAAAPVLGEIYKRCVIVAVDTSLRFLLARGIEPDFVVSVDPQYWNFRHLDRTYNPETGTLRTRMITESAVYPPCLRHNVGGIFLSGSFFPLGRFIEDQVGPKGDMGAGGSVATSAWDFSRLLGTNIIWIAGLDLSFPGLKTHFKGALFEERSHAESSRFSPAETWNIRALRDGQPFQAKRQGGGNVLTDKRLSLYASWFESRFELHKNVRNFSLSEEGLAIKGLETAPLDELLSLRERRDEINAIFDKVFKETEKAYNSPEESLDREKKYEKAKTNLFDGIKKINSFSLGAAEAAEKAITRNKHNRLDEREKEKALKTLDRANDHIKDSSVKDIVGFLFPETDGWEAEISANEKDPLIQHLIFSARFYRALSEAGQFISQT